MKSEKAKKYIEGHKWKERETCPLENVRVYIAEEAVEIAEAEMRDIALNAFLTVCQNTNIRNCGECNPYGCVKGKLFIQQLDKQKQE